MTNQTETRPAFTPAPWATTYGVGGRWIVFRPVDGSAESVPHGSLVVAHADAEEDARLIAAAPELFEALRRVWVTGRFLRFGNHEPQLTSGCGPAFADYAEEEAVIRAALDRAGWTWSA